VDQSAGRATSIVRATVARPFASTVAGVAARATTAPRRRISVSRTRARVRSESFSTVVSTCTAAESVVTAGVVTEVPQWATCSGSVNRIRT
jgi:hypothetical protein